MVYYKTDLGMVGLPAHSQWPTCCRLVNNNAFSELLAFPVSGNLTIVSGSVYICISQLRPLPTFCIGRGGMVLEFARLLKVVV